MMKNVLFGAALILLGGLSASFTSAPLDPPASEENTAEEIKWYSWDEAIELANDEPKKIFIDLYTDWCGWCKRMDATTFQDPDVVAYMNEHFIAVKVDAEQKEEIEYKGNTFKFVDAGRRGVHQLAYSLLDGRLGYPSYVYLDENQNRITISPGYKPAERMVKELTYIAEEHYKTTDYESYMQD